MTTYSEMFRETIDFAQTVAAEERDFEKARLNVAIAQAMATDELANQQRIANLIALHRHEVEYGIGNDRSYLYQGGTEELRHEIADALGIGDSNE